MMLLTAAAYAPLFEQRAVHAHYLHVKDGFRRRGVGKALLAAAVTFADEVGAEHVITSVLPQMRETQRFYARLGFGPVVVRRSATVSVLRRRLAPTGRRVGDGQPAGPPSLAAPGPGRRRPRRRLTAVRRDSRYCRQAPGAASRSRQVIREVQTGAALLVGDLDLPGRHRRAEVQRRRRAGDRPRSGPPGGGWR